MRLSVALLLTTVLAAGIACREAPMQPTSLDSTIESAVEATREASARAEATVDARVAATVDASEAQQRVAARLAPTPTPLRPTSTPVAPDADRPTPTPLYEVTVVAPRLTATPPLPTATPRPTAVPSRGCSSGVAVRDPERNAGLVGDCEALLEAKDILFARYEPNQLSRVSLNWGAEISIYEWNRVTIDGSPHRVQGLDLTGMGLTGDIPEALGWLTNLKILMLGGNQLTGCIPRGLSLEELRWDSSIDYQVCSKSLTQGHQRT